MQSCTHADGEPLRDPWRPGLFWAYITRSMMVGHAGLAMHVGVVLDCQAAPGPLMVKTPQMQSHSERTRSRVLPDSVPSKSEPERM